MEGQRPAERHSLAFAAAEALRPSLKQVRDLELLRQLVDPDGDADEVPGIVGFDPDAPVTITFATIDGFPKSTA